MRTSSKKGLVGYRRVGTCNGSWECVNESCSYLSTEGKRNNWHFEFRNSTDVVTAVAPLHHKYHVVPGNLCSSL